MKSGRFSARELYSERFDFEVYRGTPNLEYMIAAIPRTGSTHFAMELWRTGVMGAPLEYANPPFRDLGFDRLGADGSIASRWKRLKEYRTSPNGVFGFKMFIGNYVHYSKIDSAFLNHITADRVICLTRENIEAQAVSYSKAIRSGTWFNGEFSKSTPDYCALHIYSCIRKIRYQIDFWTEIFDRTGTRVHSVSYESLVRDRDAVVSEVAKFLGVQLDPSAELALPAMTIQRNGESADWLARYHREDLVALEAAYMKYDDTQFTI